MLKFSALKPDVKLDDHQTAAVRKARESGGRLLLAHPVGSGKTITYHAVVEDMRDQGLAHHPLVITPASLQQNFVDTTHKFTDRHAAILGSNLSKIPQADYHVVSLDKFRRDPSAYIKATGADTLVIDELHKARNEGTKNLASLKDGSRLVKNVIAGTGSVANNHPHDIVPQIDIVTGGKHGLGVNTGAFDKMYTGVRRRAGGPLGFIGIGPKVEERHLKNTWQLKRELNKHVHYVDKLPEGVKVPEKVVHDVPVEMSKHQNKIYQWSMGQIDPVTRWKIRMNLPPTAKEYEFILPKLTQQRQISNAVHQFDSKHDALSSAYEVPKTRAIIDNLSEHLAADPNHKAIVYSNFVQAGVDPIEAHLASKGVTYGKFIGTGNEGVTHLSRNEHVRDYLAGKNRVMLISGAGTEGLNLPGTTRHYTMDPHYNPEVLTQSEARGIRRGSPVPKVDVYRYKSYPKRNLLQKVFRTRDHGIDEWIYGIAEDKDKFNKQLTDLMKTSNLSPYRAYMESKR